MSNGEAEMRNYIIVFYPHDSYPQVTGQIEFDHGSILQIFAGTLEEACRYAAMLKEQNELSDSEAGELIWLNKIML